MQKHYFIAWLTIIVSMILFSWCEKANIQWQTVTEYPDEDKEIISILEKYAEKQNITPPIQQDSILRNEFHNNETTYEVNWYTLSWSWIKPKDTISSNEFFDWWHVDYLGDEIWWSRIEYSNKDIFCYYWLTLEQQPPYELMVWEDEDWNEIDYNKAWEEFYKIATYSTELSCWRTPEWVLRLSDLNVDAEGQEPFWFAPIRWWKITLFDINWVDYYYPDTINYDNDTISISWYHISWELKKAECTDLWKWDSHEFTVSMDFITNDDEAIHYEWCADSIDLWFTAWDEWTLQNFIDRTNYDYKQPYKIENVWYTISEIVNNYMRVDFYANEDNWDYHSYQVIMQKDENWWKVLFEWSWFEISDDECGRLNQYDNYLMEMFFLTSCPRG